MEKSEIVRKWYQFTIFTLLVLTAIYIVSHVFVPGVEIIKLSKQEITDINLILFGTAQEPSALNQKIKTSLTGDSTSKLKKVVKVGEGKNLSNKVKQDLPVSKPVVPFGLGSSKDSDSVRKATVFSYIFSVRGPLCRYDSVGLREYFQGLNNTHFAMVIANFPIRVRSYFWLTEGNMKLYSDCCGQLEGSVYLEIIFWTWFGLIASLLYAVSEALQISEFNTKEISVHVSKFFYAPIISLVIYFSINRLISDGATSMAEFSHGTIVLSFILGFFSRRAIDLMDRIKDLILPLANSANHRNANRGQ
jgi:hypothetical protein